MDTWQLFVLLQSSNIIEHDIRLDESLKSKNEIFNTIYLVFHLQKKHTLRF